MKRLLFLFLVFTLPPSAQSQIDYRIETYLDSHKIDTFFVYEFECSGDVFLKEDDLVDSCQFDEPHYLFWKQNGSYYLRRFDYCKEYKIVLLDTVNPLTFYLKNKNIINKEEIRQPIYYEIKKIKGKTERLKVLLSKSYSCYHKFRLSREPEYKYADSYNLDLKTIDGRKNINYEYNQNTRFKKLIELTTTLLQTLEKESKFVLG